MSEAIPIINSLTGEQTGTISVDSSGAAIITGRIDVPWGHAGFQTLAVIPPSEEPPAPVDVERLAASFPSTYEAMMREPRHVAAAARGLKVHTDALKMSEELSIPYEQAITRVLGEGT